METFTVHNLQELDALAPEIIKAIGSSRVVTMDAPMGAGKTTLVKALCAALGSDSVVNSPTFAIVNDYALPSGQSVFHFDLYRLRNQLELLDIAADEYFDSGNYCFVEWPELAEDILPADVCRLTIEVKDDESRVIRVSH